MKEEACHELYWHKGTKTLVHCHADIKAYYHIRFRAVNSVLQSCLIQLLIISMLFTSLIHLPFITFWRYTVNYVTNLLTHAVKISPFSLSLCVISKHQFLWYTSTSLLNQAQIHRMITKKLRFFSTFNNEGSDTIQNIQSEMNGADWTV